MVPVSRRDPRALTRPIKTAEVRPAEPETSDQERQKLEDRIAELESKLAAAETGGLPRRLGFRVSPKGAVSVYGLNANFPVTLYYEQWMRLEEQLDELKSFAEANKDLLDMREDSPEVLKEKQTKRVSLGIIARGQPRRTMIVTATTARKEAA